MWLATTHSTTAVSLSPLLSPRAIYRDGKDHAAGGLQLSRGGIKTTKALLERNADAPETRIYVGHLGIGGG